ncbi:MAG: hypothetical protein ACTSRP_19560 [Candidatus Helarchaeota archaeon]
MEKEKRPTNLKPDSFYLKYYPDVNDQKYYKERDMYIDYLKKIAKIEDLEVETYTYNKAGEKIIIEEPENYHGPIFCRIKASKGIPQGAIDLYESLRRSSDFLDFYLNYDNLSDNRKYLERCFNVLNIFDEDDFILELKQKIKMLFKILNKNYLISGQLTDVIYWINEIIYSEIGLIDEDCCIYIANEGKEFYGLTFYVDGTTERGLIKMPNFNFEKLKSLLKNPLRIKFNNFKISKEQVLKIIKQKEKWHNIDRDLTIYLERQKGKTLQELANDFGIKFNSISMVVKKVQGAINHYKGKILEEYVYKRLKSSKLFSKVVLDGSKGNPDILAYSKNGEDLFIYSLKNLKIDRKPYWLTKEELRPELENALLCSLDYKVHLILLIYDNFNDIVKQFEIDYHHPKMLISLN